MALKYKVVEQSEPGVKGGGAYQYYVRAAGRDRVSTERLAHLLAQKTALDALSVKRVLLALADTIPDLLLDNCNVELGELGTFSVSLKSEASTTPEEANWRKIRDLKVNFRVGKKIKDRVKDARFVKL